MKKIFTLILISLSLGSFAQTRVIEKHKIVRNDDNYEFMIYYPVFKSGSNVELLNKLTLESLVKNNPVKKHNVDVKSFSDSDLMYTETAKFLKKEGLTKSIEAIPFKVFVNWHFFENDKISSLIIDNYTLIGKEKLTRKTNVFNVDPKTGEVYDIKKYIIDSTELLNDVAVEFCRANHLPKNATRLDTGLKYELANLPLPSNIGFSDEGVVFFYNRGEIANIGFSAIRVVVPYSKALDNFNDKLIMDKFSISDGEKPTMSRLNQIVREFKKVKKSNKRR